MATVKFVYMIGTNSRVSVILTGRTKNQLFPDLYCLQILLQQTREEAWLVNQGKLHRFVSEVLM